MIFTVYKELVKKVEDNISNAVLVPTSIDKHLKKYSNMFNVLYKVDEVDNNYKIIIYVGNEVDKVRDEYIINHDLKILSKTSRKYGGFKNI